MWPVDLTSTAHRSYSVLVDCEPLVQRMRSQILVKRVTASEVQKGTGVLVCRDQPEEQEMTIPTKHDTLGDHLGKITVHSPGDVSRNLGDSLHRHLFS